MKQISWLLALASWLLAFSLAYDGTAGYSLPLRKEQAKAVNPIPQGKRLYEQKCSLCHQPKPLDIKTPQEWMTLIYSSGCSDVTIKLTALERNSLKHFVQDALKAK